MKRTLRILAIGLLISPVSIFAQTANSELAAAIHPATQPTAESVKLPNRDLWIENSNERTIFSSAYTTPDGEVIIHYSSVPLNYFASPGKLEPIDKTLRPTNSGWAAPNQPYPTYLNTDGSMAVTAFDGALVSFGANCTINGNKQNITAPIQVTNNEILLQNIVPNIDKQLQFRVNAIKYNYIIHQQQTSSGNSLIFSEELTIPNGYKLVKSSTQGYATKEGWAGDYLLLSPSGEVAAQIKAPLCFDANKNWIVASYQTETQHGKTYLRIHVPNAWLNDPQRAYPVTVDPLVTGPTALWTGGMMPSCIAPSFNTDSIQVTIPAQIAIMGLIVTSSFYADPFTPAIMSQGAMWFSTPCDTSQQFVVTGNAGNSPGTAYLDTFNLRNPLMCCFPQACTTRTFPLFMHLSRTGPGSGCNTTYIRYDPSTTLWPFSAYVMGRTVESFGQRFTVQTTPICSNTCTFTGNVTFRYGVPPFTVSHPWMANNVVVGTPLPCNYSAQNLTLTFANPNCPNYCDTTTFITVQPPTITDACGNTVTGLPTRTLNVLPTPAVTANPNPDSLCSGSPIAIALNACLPGSTITWNGNNQNGTGNISDLGINTGASDTTISYTAQASLNGCNSLPITIPVVVDPEPLAAFTFTQPIIAGVPTTFTDQSSRGAGTILSWQWNFGDSTTSSQQNPNTIYDLPGTYTVCLIMATDHGCDDSLCQVVEVIPAAVETPNVITPNADGINDLLAFKYLEFYTNNRLEIYDRWGRLLYQKENYTNDWNGSQYVDGTYYYVLTVREMEKTYTGFFQLIK